MAELTETRVTTTPPGEEYIVDEATDEVLRLHLDKFEGPFEVLLYLIKAQEIDIFDIPIVTITEQYLRFLEMMREENLDVVGDFLVMAATLIQIKSKMILPPDTDEEDEETTEEDPRLELVEKLLEYRKYRDVTARLAKLEELRSNWYTRNARPNIEPDPDEEEYLEVSLYDLTKALKGVMRFLVAGLPHMVAGERHSVDEKISHIQDILERNKSLSWVELFRECKSRVEMVCCFLAILELCRMGHVRAHQHRAFGDIRLFPKTGEAAPPFPSDDEMPLEMESASMPYHAKEVEETLSEIEASAEPSAVADQAPEDADNLDETAGNDVEDDDSEEANSDDDDGDDGDDAEEEDEEEEEEYEDDDEDGDDEDGDDEDGDDDDDDEDEEEEYEDDEDDGDDEDEEEGEEYEDDSNDDENRASS